METNIYYQLAQTECVLDRYKAKLFKKNLLLAGMAVLVYMSAKALTVATKKVVEVQKERDELAEKQRQSPVRTEPDEEDQRLIFTSKKGGN